MRQMRSGDFWFATSDQGAYRWDGKDFHQLTTADGLPTNNVSLHMEDQHGNLWLSCFHWHLTSGEKRGALCMWDGQTVTTFPDVPGLTENEVYSVTEDRNGHIWICATGHAVYRYDGSTNSTSFTQAQPARPDFSFGCNSIYEDRKGRLWFGFAGGLYRLEGETFVNVTRGGPLGLRGNGAETCCNPVAVRGWFNSMVQLNFSSRVLTASLPSSLDASGLAPVMTPRSAQTVLSIFVFIKFTPRLLSVSLTPMAILPGR